MRNNGQQKFNASKVLKLRDQKIVNLTFLPKKLSNLMKRNKKLIKFIFLTLYCYNAPLFMTMIRNCTEKNYPRNNYAHYL